MGLWDSKTQRTQLLAELVAIPSVTRSQAEFDFPYTIIEKLSRLQYFTEHPEHIRLHPLGDGRNVLTALVKRSPKTRDTVVLLSHFDVVDVQDYGSLRDAAFRAEELTELMMNEELAMPQAVRDDLQDGEWLFGRGTMDMKCAIVLHMALLEQATNEAFEGNVMLVTVPDEEVNSLGMRTAVPALLELAQEHNLDYQLLLNSEPMFGLYPGDQGTYVYSGSIGKLLPGFLCYGKETHVGEPWSGLNANFMSSVLTNELELCEELCEEVAGERTPPPTNLIQKGLKDDYSAQIPHRAVTMMNMFVYRKTMQEVLDTLRTVTQRAASQIEDVYRVRAKKFADYYGTEQSEVHVTVRTYEEVYNYALRTYGEEVVTENLRSALYNYDARDERDTSIQVVNQLATLCRELSPMIVLFFAPPWYPAVNTADDALTIRLIHELQREAQSTGIELRHQRYFGGISDLSFVGLQQSVEALTPYTQNTPLWPDSYELPLESMSRFHIPVLNLGPIGRDAHQWTERLELNFAFDTLYGLLEHCVSSVFLARSVGDA